MAKESNKKTDEELDAEMDEELDQLSEDEFGLPMIDDAVVDVSFGEPEDDELDSERVIDWVSSFPPGLYQKQVADLFLSEGEVYVIMDKMSITIPLMDIFMLLEKGGYFKEQE